MKKYSLGALVAAGLLVGGLSAGSASAADLGGNCCADLEERIAELEATTARKGNRKVSLTISGWVAEQVMWFDDGVESNVYVGGIGRTLQSHFKFTGQATISAGWYAGYVLHIEAGTEDSFGLSAANDDASGPMGSVVKDTDRGLYALQSFWFIKSDTLGKVSVGKQSQASDNTAILVDGSGSLVPANWVLFDGAGFEARGSGTTWGALAFCHTIGDGIGGDCNGITENVVRYDSPVFGGFSVSASWGEDDMWDVAARYAGEFNGFKLAVAAAYTENTEDTLAVDCVAVYDCNKKDVSYFQIGAYIEHVPTGLWAYGAWGREEAKGGMRYIDPIGDGDGGEAIPDGEKWYVKAGLRERWSPLGHTVLYGEYGNHNDELAPALIDAGNGDASSEFRQYGLGVVQEIDAAAMSVWVSYRHYEADLHLDGDDIAIQDFDLVKAGALINF